LAFSVLRYTVAEERKRRDMELGIINYSRERRDQTKPREFVSPCAACWLSV